jgi:hypothetical protein
MRLNKSGQEAKFHIPLPDENPDQLHLVLEIIEEDERLRSDIKAMHTGLSFPPINTVLGHDLEVVEVDAYDLVGQGVTVIKADYLQATGKVVKVSEPKMILDIIKGEEAVKNVWLTIEDENGKEHTGKLFVN